LVIRFIGCCRDKRGIRFLGLFDKQGWLSRCSYGKGICVYRFLPIAVEVPGYWVLGSLVGRSRYWGVEVKGGTCTYVRVHVYRQMGTMWHVWMYDWCWVRYMAKVWRFYVLVH